MAEFDELASKLMERSPDLTRDRLDAMIREKKERVGRGFLTDQGALFLIAADMGVPIGQEEPEVKRSIKELYAGAKDVSLDARVLGVSEPRQFSRKDGSQFMLRTMTVYDGTGTAAVKLWDEKASLPGVEGLRPGDLVSISKAYVKSDLNGAEAIHVGSGSSVAPSDAQSDIPGIDSLTVDVASVKEPDDKRDLVVSGAVDGPVGSMQFTNQRGQPGKGLKMRLRGSDGSSTRVVVWGRDESALPPFIEEGARAVLVGVRARAADGGVEIHGNESTDIRVDGSREARPVTARVLSASDAGPGRRFLTCAGADRKLLRVSDMAGMTSQVSPGDVMECMPSRAYGSSVFLDSGSFVRKVDDPGDMPSRDSLCVKIGGIRPGDECCVDAIIIRLPDRREVQTKSGESIALAEMLVEDDSGSIWVTGWRRQASLIDGRAQGEIVSITGATARAGMEGRTELSLGPFSSVSKRD